MNIEIGSLITFTYPAVHQQGTRAHDKYPKILVLHNNWQGCVHGLNFNYLTEDEINTIRMILDPFFEMKYSQNLRAKNQQAYSELENIVNRSGNPHITSPRDFYAKVVRPFIMSRGWDPYRLYKPEKMTGIRILQREYHMSGKDSYAQFQAQQQQKISQLPPDQQNQAKLGILNWFRDKFQHMRGPKLPMRTPSFQKHHAPVQTVPKITKPISTVGTKGTKGTTGTGEDK